MTCTKYLEWHNRDGLGTVALRGDDSCYRIVLNHGFHCLRLEIPGADHKWMGQFNTVSQAKSVAQEHDDGMRRLKAWEKYMMRHDPPPDLGPEWQP